MRSLLAALAVLAGGAAAAPAAWSSFPGLNGQLAYEGGSFVTPNVFAIQPLAVAPEADTRLTSAGALDRDAAWSANGRRIAFMSERNGNPEIYVMNADGSDETRLTTDPALDADPTFSPDGEQIAFNSTRDGNTEIYVMDIDGSGQTRLTVDPATDQQPDWSPDGTRIAFESDRDGNMELYAMDADGSDQTRLTFDPEIDAEASWHPDGASIAYTSGPNGAAHIYELTPGTGRTQLTRGFGDHHFPAWSPDGLQIAFTGGFGSTLVMKVGRGASATSLAAYGRDAAWGPLPPPERVPELAETVNATPTGTVLVRVDGATTAKPLTDPREIPVGSTIDTRQGEIELEAATANERSTTSVIVSEGRARLNQTRGRTPVTVLRMPRIRCARGRGGRRDRLRARTPQPAATASARSAKKKGKKTSVNGKYSKGSSDQTDWTTINTCRSTITRVREGVVEVFDLVRRRTVRIRAGERYVARARRR